MPKAFPGYVLTSNPSSIGTPFQGCVCCLPAALGAPVAGGQEVGPIDQPSEDPKGPKDRVQAGDFQTTPVAVPPQIRTAFLSHYLEGTPHSLYFGLLGIFFKHTSFCGHQTGVHCHFHTRPVWPELG